jgi:hypothetical protein
MVLSEAYESMLLAFAAAKAYWTAAYPLSVVALRVIHRKPADNARNVLARTALEGGFDWVWWVDDDQEMPELALPRLHRHRAQMASGLYGLKELPSNPLIFRFTTPPDGRDLAWYRLDFEADALKGQALVDATGFGCLLMKREPLEYVWEKTGGEPFRWSMDTTDDIHFFKVAKDGGYKVLMDLDLKVGHWGHHRFDL